MIDPQYLRSDFKKDASLICLEQDPDLVRIPALWMLCAVAISQEIFSGYHPLLHRHYGLEWNSIGPL